MLDDRESTFMHGAVMASTQPHEIVEPGCAAVGPVQDVVRVAAAGGAAGKPTARVPRQQGTTNRRGNRARLPTDVEHGAIRVVMHHHHRRITRQSPGRFRGNVRPTIGHFEGAVERTWLGSEGARSVARRSSAPSDCPRAHPRFASEETGAVPVAEMRSQCRAVYVDPAASAREPLLLQQ